MEKIKILVVDDEVRVRDEIAEFLTENKYKVYTDVINHIQNKDEFDSNTETLAKSTLPVETKNIQDLANYSKNLYFLKP